MTILEKIQFEEEWLSRVNLTKENIKIAFGGIRATALESQRWIPCSERLPEDYGEYICTMSNDNVQECGFVPSGEKGLIPGWSTCEADGFKKLDYRDIKAWLPLPEPYRESEDKE